MSSVISVDKNGADVGITDDKNSNVPIHVRATFTEVHYKQTTIEIDIGGHANGNDQKATVSSTQQGPQQGPQSSNSSHPAHDRFSEENPHFSKDKVVKADEMTAEAMASKGAHGGGHGGGNENARLSGSGKCFVLAGVLSAFAVVAGYVAGTMNANSKACTTSMAFSQVSGSIRFEENSFVIDSAEYGPQNRAHLETVACLLENNPNEAIDLGAHASEKGTKRDNQTLSEDRLYAVQDALINDFGVQAQQIAGTEAHGEAQPVYTNENDVLNQSVSITLAR